MTQYAHTLAAAGMFLALAHPATAAVSPQEAAELKSTLTPLGGERAGNKDGTIPAWNGGFKGQTAEPGAHRPDYFADEKPILAITSANFAQYSAKLPQGVLELFHRYPETMRVEVYPPHRTAMAPQWVYDNTFANATRARTTNGGNSIEGAFGGIPFPIPKTGKEAMWNEQLYWRGSSINDPGSAYIGSSNGRIVLGAVVEGFDEFPYYNPNGSVATLGNVYWTKYQTFTEPAYQNGNAALNWFELDPISNGSPGWQYLPGQRRVRKSPNLQYDMPNFFLSGLGQFDEAFGFNGALDRYDWSVAGKQEMYVPYNANKFWLLSIEEQMADNRHHWNPKAVRFELHRVWAIDAKLAPGARNVVARRRVYLDEDTWNVAAADEWDASGAYWRFLQVLPIVMPDVPAVVGATYMEFDFKRGDWAIADDITNSLRPQWKPIAMHSSFFTPDNLAAVGVR